MRPGTPYASCLGLNPSPTDLTNSFIIMGNQNIRAKSPGYQKMWAGYVDKWGPAKVVTMPPSVETLMTLGALNNTTVHGNDLSNSITVGGSGQDNVVHLHGGDDRFNALGDTRVVVYGGSGNNVIQGGDRADTLYGGTGDDLIRGNSGNDYLVGGAGNDTILGGDGNDTIIADAGSDDIDAGPGNDLIIVTGGSHILRPGSGTTRMAIQRTGETQTITWFPAFVTLDLTDWAPLQPVRVERIGNHTHVTAEMERVICQWVAAATVASQITGATTNVIA